MGINLDLLSDAEVIQRVRTGDTALFEILIMRHSQRLYRAVRSILPDDDSAKDVMQETFVRAYTHLNQYKGNAQFSSWLIKIAVRESLARLRSRRRIVEIDALPEADERSTAMASKMPGQEQEILTRTFVMMLEAAVDALPQRYRSVFMLRDIQGLTTVETAECLGITKETVRVRLHRARSILRKQISAKAGAATASAFQFLGERCATMGAAVLEKISTIEKRD